MSNFARWFTAIDGAPFVQPADGDAILHTRHGNRFLLFEFKPARASVPIGQSILLDGFGRKPGCHSVLAFDPYAHDRSDIPYPQDEELSVIIYRGGEQAVTTTTFASLNRVIALWYHKDVDLLELARR